MEPLGERIEGLAPIYTDAGEVSFQLIQLFGLTPEPFMHAVSLAWLEWAGRSEFDAPSIPGTLFWGHTVRHERKLLFSEHEWQHRNLHNFATSVSPDERIAIAVETGDRFTGTTTGNRRPRTNSRKGPRALQMVQDNNALLQGDVFTGFPQRRLIRTEVPLLWIHLIRLDHGDVVHELSLPMVADERNRITGWRCRLILPRWVAGPDAGRRRAAPEPSPDAEVRITRRNA